MCNLKSNKTLKEILEYKKALQNLKFEDIEFVLFPSTLYLSFFYGASYKIGSQNISRYNHGSITGEILASQLKSLMVKYVLINHVEAKENICDIPLKIKNATKNGLKVVLCIGEKNHQTMDETFSELKSFLKEIITALTKKECENLILAYEPAWTIKKDNTCRSEVINSIAGKLKKHLKKEYSLELSILYGGGISVKNFSKLAKLDNIDGYLLGNSANNPENILKILEKI